MQLWRMLENSSVTNVQENTINLVIVVFCVYLIIFLPVYTLQMYSHYANFVAITTSDVTCNSKFDIMATLMFLCILCGVSQKMK